MKLYNSLTNKKETFKPNKKGEASVYSCGPTVYDRAHIGNMRAFIIADLLARSLKANGFKVKHVMNITDIDDKMIARSADEFPKAGPEEARAKLASKYKKLFLADAKLVGIDVDGFDMPDATNEIDDMQELINILLKKELAYSAADGIYFDLSKYSESADYGVLAKVDMSHARQRVAADEYDKDQATDFALWKAAKPGEPSWPFKSGDVDMPGRPGWHIECSVMSTKYLGQPFDIHTGGVDLKFPHHENEIAQSQAAGGKDLANYFIHSEHMLVDGSKMSKRLGNFITIDEIQQKGFDPLSLRLLILQSHYRHQQNFTWEALSGAHSFLQRLRAMADRQFQIEKNTASHDEVIKKLKGYYDQMLASANNDLDTPHSIALLGEMADYVDSVGLANAGTAILLSALKFTDALLGLNLADRKELNHKQEILLAGRSAARKNQKFDVADKLRKELQKQGIGLNDTPHGTYWFRLND